MLSISLENPVEVALAVIFVIIAFAAFLGTFAFAIAYIYSNVFERWPDYSNKRRWQVLRNILLAVAVISILVLLASTR